MNKRVRSAHKSDQRPEPAGAPNLTGLRKKKASANDAKKRRTARPEENQQSVTLQKSSKRFQKERLVGSNAAERQRYVSMVTKREHDSWPGDLARRRWLFT